MRLLTTARPRRGEERPAAAKDSSRMRLLNTAPQTG